MAQLNAKWTSVLARLSKEVPDNVYTKLKPYNDITAKDSPLWITFASFRQKGEKAAQDAIPSSWEGSKEELHLNTIRYIIRLRRNIESWEGQELQELTSEINWGISNGAGEDLFDFIAQAKTIASREKSIGIRLELLRLERMVSITYLDSGEERIARLKAILNERAQLFLMLRNSSLEEVRIVEKWKRKPHRVKSDLLFRLSKTLDDFEIELLKEYMQLHTKNGKQFRLIEYYRGLSVWSKEREHLDWRGEKLAQLKNRTLLWLISRMGRLGRWQGSELHGWIGDIRWCKAKGIDPEELGLFDIAIDRAISEESYESLVTLFELRENPWPLLMINQNSTFKTVLEQLEEIEELHEFRIQYFEQIKRVNLKTGRNSVDEWQCLFDALNTIAPNALLTGEALREFYLLQLLAASSLKLYDLAINAGLSLINLYETREYLASSNWRRHFKELRAIVYSFSISGRQDLAMGVITKMDSLSNQSANLQMQSLIVKILAVSHIYHTTNDPQLAEKAWVIYVRFKSILPHAREERNLIWLHFFIAKVCLDLGKYQDAVGILNQIIDHKTRSNIVILAHSRLMLLLCYLGLRTDIEVVFDASMACSMFIHRQKTLPPHLHLIARSIKKIATFEYNSQSQQSAFEVAIRDSTSLHQSFGDQSIDPSYHLILSQLMNLLKDHQR